MISVFSCWATIILGLARPRQTLSNTLKPNAETSVRATFSRRKLGLSPLLLTLRLAMRATADVYAKMTCNIES
ncbi:MAG TPA: hypothetical protein DDW52_21815 [Planctomycetaceae bacterium]|nr:hypothetical protein [Planctomycetaceae bacterium]